MCQKQEDSNESLTPQNDKQVSGGLDLQRCESCGRLFNPFVLCNGLCYVCKKNRQIQNSI